MAKSVGNVRIYVENLPRVVKLLKGDELLAGIWREAMREATVLVERRAKDLAPRRTGALQASITHSLSAAPVPKWGRISTNIKRGKVRYAFVLQAGKGKGGSTLHYRGTNKETRGWLNKALEDMQGRVNQILERAGREIERRWQSG